MQPEPCVVKRKGGLQAGGPRSRIPVPNPRSGAGERQFLWRPWGVFDSL